MSNPLEKDIITSYQINAEAWTDVIRRHDVKSRMLVTDQAIVDAVLAHHPTSVLDVGCGEGWLARALAARNIHVSGIDAVAPLINAARELGGGTFEVCGYHEMEGSNSFKGSYDVIVCNFALLGETSTSQMLLSCAKLLTRATDRLIIQTLHPFSCCEPDDYRDGWRKGSWAGFPSDFKMPPDWYFRTLQSWTSEFVEAGLQLDKIREARYPDTGHPASIIFECAKRPTRLKR